MKHILKRGLALLCMLTLLVGVLPLSASATELGEFTVLSTTDMHGRCWDTNLLTGGSVSNSMLNVATAVAKIRSEKSNVILIDNGDTYQGTPVSSYQLSRQAAGLTTDPNPMALSLTEIRYDFSVLGNHEFNYGWDTMEEVRDYLCMAGVLTVTANLYYDGTDGVHAKGENVFSPYILQTVTAGGKDYKIAVIGFENTDCPRWDVADNYPGIVFTHPDNTYGSMAWEAERYIALAKADGAYIADLITDVADLADGDKVFLLHVAGSQLVSTVANGSKLAPSTDVTLGDKQIGTSDATAMFTLKKGSDGYLRFVGADGTCLTSAPTGNGLSMSAENEYSLWELEAKEGSEGIFHVHSVNAAYNGNTNQYLEFYGGFTTYGFQSGGGAYEYMIFRLSGTGPKPTEPTEPTEPSNPFTPCSHSYQASAVAATCTEPGYTLYTCSKCGESYRGSFVPSLGHNFVNGTCTRCAAADPNYVPAEDPTEDRPLYASFHDLEKEAWYRDGIVYALKNGLMNGVAKYTFDPDGEVTRAMLVTILYRAAGSPSAKGLKIPFEDVEPGTWYTNAVAWAADQNIVLGVSDTEFAPDESITREQLATILYRYVGEPAPAGNLAAYIDAKEVSSYAISAMKWAIGEKIITGIDNRLAPQETATRAQIATVFFRFLDPVAAQESQERLENDPNPYD